MEGDLSLGPGTSHRADVALGQTPGAAADALPEILDLTAAKPLRDSLAALSAKGAVILDASAVERMSTPCAQLLLAAGRAAAPAGTSFRIRDPSAVFRAALDDLGLQTEFSKWME